MMEDKFIPDYEEAETSTSGPVEFPAGNCPHKVESPLRTNQNRKNPNVILSISHTF